VRMLVGLPRMKLEDELPGPIHELIVLRTAVAARAAKQPLIPPAGRFHILHGDQWLRLHRASPMAPTLLSELHASQVAQLRYRCH